MINRLGWPLLLVLVMGAHAVFADTTLPTPRPLEPGADIRVSLITMGPGEEAYEKFGHIALRVQRPGYPDGAFNWGIFDFAQKNFTFNFIQGRMLYSTEVEPGQLMIDEYAKHNRTIWEQELNLTPAQKLAVFHRCVYDIQPANKDYLYDYYRNNCSTRVRDLLDGAVGGEIRRQTENVATDRTFRWHTRRDTSDALPLYVALETMLGPSVDHPLNAWDEMFLPTVLRERLRQVTVLDDEGHRVPIVKSEQILHQGTEIPERERPQNFVPLFFAIGAGVATLLVCFARLAVRRKWARWVFALIAIPWMLLIGIGGMIILWASCMTDHVAGYYNNNLLNVSPLYLLLLPLLLWVVFRRRGTGKRAFYVASAILGLAVAGLLLKGVGLFRQVNGDIIALTLPAHAALGWIVWDARKRITTVGAKPPALAASGVGAA